MPVITREVFCRAARPDDRLALTLLFTWFTFVHDRQRINFRAYFTNCTPGVYTVDVTARRGRPFAGGRL